MFIEERLEKIMELVHKNGKITVKDAITVCGVSADTIRRDFRRLMENDMVLRTHGGIMKKQSAIFDSSTSERNIKNKDQKEVIGKKALEFIKDGETIAIDGGTTTIELAKGLNTFNDLTLVCYSLDIANVVLNYDQITTILLGGLLRNKTASLVGPDAVLMASKLHADTVFLGANALDAIHGLMTPRRMEAEIKETLISISDRVIILADSSKINKKALFTFCSLKNVDILITDTMFNESYSDMLNEYGVEIVIA